MKPQIFTIDEPRDNSPIGDPRDNYRARLALLDSLIEMTLEASPSDADLDNLVAFFDNHFRPEAARLRWHDGNRT